MHKILTLIALMLTAGLLLAAETTPLDDYFANPNSQTFVAAYTYCGAVADTMASGLPYTMLQATLANLETQRLTTLIAPQADSMGTGESFQFANLLLGQNLNEDAVPLYDKLNADYPAWSCPWRHKGQALYELKRYKEAEVSLMKAVETNVQHYDAYIWLAKTQYQMKKYKPALQNLETAKTLDPNGETSEDGGISQAEVDQLYTALLNKVHKTK